MSFFSKGEKKRGKKKKQKNKTKKTKKKHENPLCNHIGLVMTFITLLPHNDLVMKHSNIRANAESKKRRRKKKKKKTKKKKAYAPATSIFSTLQKKLLVLLSFETSVYVPLNLVYQSGKFSIFIDPSSSPLVQSLQRGVLSTLSRCRYGAATICQRRYWIFYFFFFFFFFFVFFLRSSLPWPSLARSSPGFPQGSPDSFTIDLEGACAERGAYNDGLFVFFFPFFSKRCLQIVRMSASAELQWMIVRKSNRYTLKVQDGM
jgi:hypothetical protein